MLDTGADVSSSKKQTWSTSTITGDKVVPATLYVLMTQRFPEVHHPAKGVTYTLL